MFGDTLPNGIKIPYQFNTEQERRLGRREVNDGDTWFRDCLQIVMHHCSLRRK